MSSFFNTLKAKFGHKKASSKSNKNEVHILPVPGNTNEPPQLGGGLNSNPEWAAHNAPGPFIPDRDMANRLEEPATREALHARAAQLNSGH